MVGHYHEGKELKPRLMAHFADDLEEMSRSVGGAKDRLAMFDVGRDKRWETVVVEPSPDAHALEGR